jgi:hypothetical protein
MTKTPSRSRDRIRLDACSEDCNRAGARLDELILQLAQSSKIDNVKRDQLVAALRAGRQYLFAPRARRDFVDDLVVRPLRRIAKLAPSEQYSAIANEFLGWLLRAIP